jgi:hypothetical protein
MLSRKRAAVLAAGLGVLGVPGAAAAASALAVVHANEEAIGDGSVLAPAIVDVPLSPQRPRWFGRIGLGFAYRYAFGESMLGAALEGELGAQDHRLAGGVRIRIEAGRMDIGLRYQAVSFGPFLWLPPVAQRLRFGVGLDLGSLLLNRRTTPGSSMWTVLLGGRLDSTVDLVRIGATGALQALAGLSGQVLTSAPGPLAVVTTFGLGYRP